LIFGPVGIIGTLIASLTHNFYSFLVCFCCGFGVTNGMIYILPVNTAWAYFPDNIGLASGIVISGFGFGAFFFNFISTAIANPWNDKPLDDKSGRYPDRVGQNVPIML
jgi:MFS family permease